MDEGHDRAKRLGWPIAWRSRAVFVAIILIAYAAAFYFIVRTRAARNMGADGPLAFWPAVSQVWIRERGGISSRPWRPQSPKEDATLPPRRWKFPPIDLWPSPPGRAMTRSEFTPVTQALPDPPDAQAVPAPGSPPPAKSVARHSSLRMVQWIRPDYSADECASLGAERSVVLDLLIDPNGQAVKIAPAETSGSPELDEAALSAARVWRFSPPVWKSKPVEVWGQIELRFHCSA
jgi:TonB family protein